MAATGLSLELRSRDASRVGSRDRVFARSRADVWLVAAAAGAIFVAFATVYVSNTVAHCHLHIPLFASRPLSRALSLFLSVSLFVPQTAWKQRHLWHHAGEPRGRRVLFVTRTLVVEV